MLQTNVSSNKDFPLSRQALEQLPPKGRSSFSKDTIQYFNQMGEHYLFWKCKMETYLAHTEEFLKSSIPNGKRVLLIGCATPRVLEVLNPSKGIGIDVSEKLINICSQNNRDSKISYYHTSPEDFKSPHPFDYIILLNVVDHSHDIFSLIGELERFCHADTKVILSMMNPLWHTLAGWASILKLRIPDFSSRTLVASRMLSTALEIKQFKVIQTIPRVLFPKKIPFLSYFCNQFLSRLPLFRDLCFIQYVFAKPNRTEKKQSLSASVVIPCFNEEENIRECVLRVPIMGRFTEIIIVNDGSKDRTGEVATELSKEFDRVKVISYSKNRGKGEAVLEGLNSATGDIVMILDADMTVPPEELPDFFEALSSGAYEFASGTRFIYPMEKQAMRLSNYIGNLIFSKLVEVIIGTSCTDTLCGTKAMKRSDFTNFKIEDSSWGDFDFIFHAAKLKLRSVQIPVHYKSRVRGVSKMKAFTAGTKFLRQCFREWKKIA